MTSEHFARTEISSPSSSARLLLLGRAPLLATSVRRRLRQAIERYDVHPKHETENDPSDNVIAWDRTIIQCVSATDLRQRLDRAGHSIVVLAFATDEAIKRVRLANFIATHYSSARVVVLLSRADRRLADAFREAGAIMILHSSREAVSLVEAYLQCHAKAPPPNRTPLEEVEAALPWGLAAPSSRGSR